MSQLQVTGEAKIRDIQGPVVANSGVVTALDGDASQYVRGDGTLADFPTSTGGGSSVSYYLNSSVSQGTIGGVAYRQLSKTPISGAGTDIAISSNGYVASYITDANDPALLEVPAGNFNCEFYFSVNSNSHNPYVYAELYKYDGTTFTLLGSNVAIPEYLTNGTTLSAYYFAIPVAVAALTVTDRIAIRIYVNVDGRTVTLHTENNHLCQVVTTFSKGLISLNNLTRQNQFFATGTSGTDFNISSTTATHTFNIPSASATNRGLITTGSQTIAGDKTFSGSIILNGGVDMNNTLNVNSGFFIRNNVIGSTLYTSFSINKASNIETLSYLFSTGFASNLLFNDAATYSYTFPTSSGTVALTSNLSSYVPYTGATTDLNLGLFNLFANQLNTQALQINTIGGGNAPIIFYMSSVQKASIDASSSTLTFSANNTNGFQFQNPSNAIIFSISNTGVLGNGTNSFTFPASSGTIALTSNLSSYVPYTGATSNVDLGTYSIGANTFLALGNGTSGGAISFTQTGTLSGISTGVASIGSVTAGQLSFYYGNNLFASILSNTSLTASRTYTLPDLSGTLALLEAENKFTLVNSFDQSINYKTDAVLVGISGYISQAYAKSGSGASSILSMKIADGSSVKNISLDFIGSAVSTPYSYLFPAFSGTMALLEGTQTFSGAKTFSGLASFTNTSGINLQYGAYINKGNTPLAFSSGTTNIYSDATTNNIVIRDNSSIAKLEFNNSTQTYTFPAATGTLALTSNLSAYLPLAGGTLTGALSGTSATFSGSVTSDDLILTAGTLFGAGNTGFSNRASDTTLYLQMPATGFNITDNALNTRFSITQAGAATFSSSVQADFLVVGTTAATSGGLRLGTQVAIRARNVANNANIPLIESTATDAVAIASGGANVGIGMSDPQAPLHIIKALGSNVFAIGESGTNIRFAIGQEASYTGNYINSTNIDLKIQSYLSGGSGGTIIFQTGASGSGSLTERMRITSGGNVCVNSTRASAALVVDSNLNTLTGIDMRDTGTTGGAYIYFQNSGGNQAGIITHSGTTSITYTSTSDYRLKENVKIIENGLDRVLSLKPVTYTWIDCDNEQGEGFLAHELQEIVPLAVVGQKDELKEDGTIKPQSIDNSRIVPILVKAIQEMNTKLDEQNQTIQNLQEQINILSK